MRAGTTNHYLVQYLTHRGVSESYSNEHVHEISCFKRATDTVSKPRSEQFILPQAQGNHLVVSSVAKIVQ